jgi:hypothetical protein
MKLKQSYNNNYGHHSKLTMVNKYLQQNEGVAESDDWSNLVVQKKIII